MVAFVGSYYTSKDNDSRLRSEYIKIAVGILQDKPSEETRSIRKWAAGIINFYSDVKIDEKAENQLTNEQLSKFIELSARALRDFSLSRNSEYEFTWEGDSDKGYSFELEKYSSGKWVSETGMTVMGNRVSLSVPVGVKLRWRASEEPLQSKQGNWNELFLTSVF